MGPHGLERPSLVEASSPRLTVVQSPSRAYGEPGGEELVEHPRRDTLLPMLGSTSTMSTRPSNYRGTYRASAGGHVSARGGLLEAEDLRLLRLELLVGDDSLRLKLIELL